MMEGLDILAAIIGVCILSAATSYFVAFLVVHDAIDNERRIQERKKLRESKAEWEKTHIPDDPEIVFRRKR